MGFIGGGKHARNATLLQDFLDPRELTPGVEGEAVEGFDMLANTELWSLLFSVTAGPARDLVQDCRPDGRRALLRLRFEYRPGETPKSVRELESILSKAAVGAFTSPHEQLREMVRAHRALKKSQPYRDEDMLQRSILQAIDVDAYHVLHMQLEQRVDTGISTTALIHEIVQYYGSYVSLRAAASAMAATSINCIKVCDICGVAPHWLRDCPLVHKVKELARVEAGAAASAEGAAVAGAVVGFWDEVDHFERCEDGTTL